MFTIQRESPLPIYQQIARWLRDQIQIGMWQENHRLKSEPELAEELGVNRGTLRKAINDLINEGLLVTIHGRGTFVATPKLEQSLADRLVASSEDLTERGIAFETQVLEQRVSEADGRVAQLLAIPEGSQIFLLRRVRYSAAKPFMAFTNYIPYAHVPGIEQLDFTQASLFRTLETRYQRDLNWGKRNFEARVATDDIAAALQMTACNAVMYLNQVVYAANGMVEETSNVYFRGDYFRLTASVRRSGSRAAEVNAYEFGSLEL